MSASKNNNMPNDRKDNGRDMTLMLGRLDELKKRYNDLTEKLGSAEVASDPREYRKYAEAQAELATVVRRYDQYRKIVQELDDAERMAQDESDEELQDLAREEWEKLTIERDELETELVQLLVPKDPRDKKNVLMEIRAGTGGDEAALFAADLFRMYTRYAESMRWKVEIMGSHPTGIGGFKEIVFLVEGTNAYRTLKYESGVHRVQRVPETEASGRLHTSAVTVAVLPEAEEVDVAIDPKDIRIDVFRSSGPGGQSVNTTDSGVRITHVPTKLVVTCQDERSQHKNRAKAMKVLRARVLAMKEKEQTEQLSADRKSQIGSGDRSERIRTYNFPQNRVTDHRIGLTLYRLDAIIEGDIGELVQALSSSDIQDKIAELSKV